MSISRCVDDLARSGACGRARRTSTARSCPGRCPGSSSGCPAGPGRRRARGSPLLEGDGEVQRRRRLRDAALLVGERDHARRGRDSGGRRGTADRRASTGAPKSASRIRTGSLDARARSRRRARRSGSSTSARLEFGSGSRRARPCGSRPEADESHDHASFTTVQPDSFTALSILTVPVVQHVEPADEADARGS